MTITIPERIPRWPEPDRWVHHLPAGPANPEVTFRPIVCGGGIAFPSHTTTTPLEDICPDCRAGETTP